MNKKENNKKKGKPKGNHICIHPPWMFSAPCRVPLVCVLHLGRHAICSIRRTLGLSLVFISSACVCAYVVAGAATSPSLPCLEVLASDEQRRCSRMWQRERVPASATNPGDVRRSVDDQPSFTPPTHPLQCTPMKRRRNGVIWRCDAAFPPDLVCSDPVGSLQKVSSSSSVFTLFCLFVFADSVSCKSWTSSSLGCIFVEQLSYKKSFIHAIVSISILISRNGSWHRVWSQKVLEVQCIRIPII